MLLLSLYSPTPAGSCFLFVCLLSHLFFSLSLIPSSTQEAHDSDLDMSDGEEAESNQDSHNIHEHEEDTQRKGQLESDTREEGIKSFSMYINILMSCSFLEEEVDEERQTERTKETSKQ